MTLHTQNREEPKIWEIRTVGARGLLAMLLTCSLVQGCAINPVSGRPEVTLISTEGERKLGREEAKKVEETIGLTRDTELTAYVTAIGRRLAEHSPRQNVEYKFFVVEMVEPNAFALPGGYVYVSRGLLPLVNSEDELASVIGHEIGHVAARHSVQRLSAAAPFAIIAGITGSVTGLVSERLGNAVAGIPQFAGNLVLAPYGRKQERQADTIGLTLAARGGWNPEALSRFLHTLGREEELRKGGPRKTSFLDSHPSTPERVEQTAKEAKQLTRESPHPIASDQAGFLSRLEGLVVGPNPANGVFVEERFVHPHLDFVLEFPKVWSSHNSPQMVAAVEPEKAAMVLLEAAESGNDPQRTANNFLNQLKIKEKPQVETFKIGTLPAARVVLKTKLSGSPTSLDFNWIAHQGKVYRILGMCSLSKFEQYRQTFSQIVQSFRPLTSRERAEVKVIRLRMVTAREDEAMFALLKRTESVWSPEEAAVANGLEAHAPLRGGQLLKVAIQERYGPP